MSRLEELLTEMGGIGDPWELFEPYLFKDKLGESVWVCEVNSVDVSLWRGKGNTPLEAVEACYKEAKAESAPSSGVKKNG